MRVDLNKVSTESLQAASTGLNAVLDDLKDDLGDARFNNEFFIRLLNLQSVFASTWMRRERQKAGL